MRSVRELNSHMEDQKPDINRDDNMLSLEPILTYKMTPDEAQAYKLCVIWSDLCLEILPEYGHFNIPRKGDPRKSHLFRYCWKLLRETKNLIKDTDYQDYIRAQLEVMKNIKIKDASPRIDPMILVGEKAWKRWMLWKRRFDRLGKSHSLGRGEDIQAPIYVVVQGLEKSCEFLRQRFEGHPSPVQIQQAKESGDLKQWVALGQVSPYYILLSPFCRRVFPQMQFDNYFPTTDFDLFKKSCTMEVLEIAKRIYPSEFGS
jgi:hypothetical protein